MMVHYSWWFLVINFCVGCARPLELPAATTSATGMALRRCAFKMTVCIVSYSSTGDVCRWCLHIRWCLQNVCRTFAYWGTSMRWPSSIFAIFETSEKHLPGVVARLSLKFLHWQARDLIRYTNPGVFINVYIIFHTCKKCWSKLQAAGTPQKCVWLPHCRWYPPIVAPSGDPQGLQMDAQQSWISQNLGFTLAVKDVGLMLEWWLEMCC